MRAGRISLLLGICVLGLILLMVSRRQARDDRSSESVEPVERLVQQETLEEKAPLSRRPLSRSAAESEKLATSDKPGILAGLNERGATIEQDLAIVDNLLFSYQSVFREFPYGDNAELVKVFQGANPRGIAFIPKDESSLNASGELIDRWGTPFFFHRLAGSQIEVRSAGPDGIHWSEDDFSSVDADDSGMAKLSPQLGPSALAD